eukprot:gene15590-19921_t
MLNLSAVHKNRGLGSQRYSLVIPALHLGAGEQLAIVGPSGCGKSTLLDLLALVLAPDQVGRFEFNQLDIGGLWRRMRAALVTPVAGAGAEAVSAIDIALWDLLGKKLDAPIHVLLA